ncbi:hypothetical protein [Micromonospora robiginosa]|uniref:Uncharacterized protein n=1 Tax=Micromonospora robiginosa TaxID=2749844 RepID=A0A7L6BEH8_9ACTN|nr:hypothetical protein [Micromonospora ferruginea]QLQ40339.2 hypothetical protein H1D33_14045 [Micromonospora ferruginea]
MQEWQTNSGLGGVLTVSGHLGYHPTWDCERCGEPWPCPALRDIPRHQLRPAALIPVMAFLLRGAIRDLRGRAEGPEPPEIVRRFLWFLPLTEVEARAIARRLR